MTHKQEIENLLKEVDELNDDVDRLRAELVLANAFVEKYRNAELKSDQWRAVAEQLAEELDWRFDQDPWRNPKSGAGMAIAAYEKLKGSK